MSIDDATGLAAGVVPPGAPRRSGPGGGVGTGLVVTVLAVVGFDLRTAVTSVSAVLPRISDGLHASAVFDSLASTLAPVVFAGAGLVAPAVLRRLGLLRGLLVGLAATTAGLVARAAAPTAATFLVLSVLTLAGLGVANVALPAVVKQYLPTRIGLGTAVYTAMLSIGTATAAALTVPLADATDGWRVGLGAWALPALGGAAFAGLLLRSRPDRVARPARAPVPGAATPQLAVLTMATVARSRLGWAVAILFAGQSASSYLMFAYLPTIAGDHGFDPAAAGLLLSLFSILGISASILPLTLGRLEDQRLVVAVLSGCWLVGDLGLALAPGAAWLWVVLLGVGSSLFTVGLLMIPMRTRSAGATAALSGFALAVAYVVSAVVVFAAGTVHQLTGSWVPVLLAMAVSMTGVAAAGLVAGRPGTIEDTLPR
jgi:CP family cyanate transporter-like MFS transporter